MATAKKAATTKSAGSPAKKAVKKVKTTVSKGANKFKNRPGPKSKAMYMDSNRLVTFITDSLAPVNVEWVLVEAARRFDQKTLKSFLKKVLPLMDGKTRKSILTKFWVATKPTLSEQDKKDLILGRKMRKLAQKK
jgi:hypothetical protein